jgi:asparagine synthase (glutamine-hydrolysing)
VCGIAGIYDFADSPPPRDAALAAMVASMRHRGPDEQTQTVRGRVGLGISRLAIIDPEGSHQPLVSETGDVTVVFNGEIYNYRELHAALEKEGHAFATRGDGEVIVHGYEQWGTGVFARLRGMFAIALWDAPRRRLVLARDRMGIKPLYLCRTPSSLLFASEAKALFASGMIAPELRPELLDTYLTYRYVPAPDTLFRGVRKVRAGEFHVIEDSGETVERYHVHAFTPKTRIGEAEAAEQLDELLVRSIEYHLQSDVPLGVFLSGGLDSGFLTALASEHVSGTLDTFSVGFDRGGIYDETAAAAVVARRFQTRQHALRMDAATYARMLPEAVYYLDEPMADPSSVPMMAISRLAAEHVKVVLSGEGADELFAGYPRYFGEAFAARLVLPGGLAAWGARTLPLSRSLARGLEGVGLRDVTRRHLFWQTIVGDDMRRRLLLDTARGDGHALAAAERIAAEALAGGDIEAIDRLFYFDLRSWLVEDLLLKKDKMGMSASIEARVPYLDQDVVAFALRLPASLKVRGLKGKRVFRRVLRNRLPEEILKRPKVGFAVPLNQWFRDELSAVLEGALAGPDAFLAPFVSRDGVAGMIARHRAGRDLSLELLALLVLELWGRIYLRGEARGELAERFAAASRDARRAP